jgi:cyclic pyranopterin phosphate synthase
MKDVTAKSPTLRQAVAEAMITMPEDVQTLLRERQLEKGDALEIARAAGILAAKKTWDLIPFCHPLPLTHVQITYVFESEGVRLQALVKTIAPTGVEMEAMTAASLTALTLYDMLKPHTNNMEIRTIHLISKTGGKSGDYFYQPITSD